MAPRPGWTTHVRLQWQRHRLVVPLSVAVTFLGWVGGFDLRWAALGFRAMLAVMPVVAAADGAPLLVDDPALEVVRATPIRLCTLLCGRLGTHVTLYLAGTALVGAVGLLRFGFLPISRMFWTVPVPLVALSLLATAAAAWSGQGAVGGGAAAAVWLAELLMAHRLLDSPWGRAVLLFPALYLSSGPEMLCNALGLLAAAGILGGIAGLALRRPERFMP